MSVLSFPERGPWGNARWRGNCSGHVYAHLFDLLKPRTFCDPMVGSGTSTDVARERGIDAVGLDLHSGFNALRDRISLALPAHWNGAADLCLSHPPYWDMVIYSGEVWGQAHPDDLSRCASADEFLEKLALALLNQRDATREHGVYGLILGDLRRGGEYHALASDIQAYLPRRERRAILIKAQHGVQSAGRQYAPLRFGRVTHETIVLYERLKGDVYFALGCAVAQQQTVSAGTWKAVLRLCLQQLPRTFTVQQAYAAVLNAAPERVRESQHWQAKIRQTLGRLPEVRGLGEGRWELTAA
ncbi:hypothetical protein IHN32_00515 [Deinococcus sp. 14RED07]|uniref:hypothetical protein n=1 Tax=Deinococcus sp. 14RED07 TaxID=2745874 RepID=UPI001E408596|nr:hypothetical protein [Deinococcus sp. 14RED07]